MNYQELDAFAQFIVLFWVQFVTLSLTGFIGYLGLIGLFAGGWLFPIGLIFCGVAVWLLTEVEREVWRITDEG